MFLPCSIDINSSFVRVPVGLLHRIMEAKIGNKPDKILDRCVLASYLCFDKASKACVHLSVVEKKSLKHYADLILANTLTTVFSNWFTNAVKPK